MGRMIMGLFMLFLLGYDLTFAGKAMAQPTPPDPILIKESEPVVINDAEFVIAAEVDWKPGKPGVSVPIDIQLRIKNLSKIDQGFVTFDSFGIAINQKDGTKLLSHGGRDSTRFTRAIIIPAGGTYSISRTATLRWDAERKSSEFRYEDGTGNVQIFGPLTKGQYALSFWYIVPSTPRPRFENLGNAPRWIGRVESKAVSVEIVGR